MKTPDEMMEYFRSMPKKAKVNPYWKFTEEPAGINAIAEEETIPLDLALSSPTLAMVRGFFRLYYESFHSEAQVLCVSTEDTHKLTGIGVPILGNGRIGPFEVTVMVLPQDNHMGTSVISETFWQKYIVDRGIVPVARIHSHHVLDPYQSMTDYSTLNSGTLEMVIGKITNDELNICYWLDVPGTDIKAQTFLAKETKDGTFAVIPHKFNGPDARNALKLALNTGAGLDPERDKAILEMAKKNGSESALDDIFLASGMAIHHDPADKPWLYPQMAKGSFKG